ncbi:cation transporter [Rubritalea tangerina]|uniref:Cation transporter n=1 Tax=Rubritalea tangerina TaxID=430798 RepID=A0ABW4Z894_9BACT
MSENSQHEEASLKWAMIGNIFMGIAGVTASYLSNSDALLIDGLYSLVNFASALVAMKVAKNVQQMPNPEFPYGYYANESLYVLFRSLVLMGILLFACFGALDKIFHYLSGGEVPKIVLGPIITYSILMVAICFGLAATHHRNWLKTQKQSNILQTEKSAAIVDGFMSAGAGGALLAVTLLSGTFLEGIIPIADSILVLILCSTMLGTPASLFRKSMAEIQGKATDPELAQKTRDAIHQTIDPDRFELIDFNMTKLGRGYFCVSHIRPKDKVDVSELDTTRQAVTLCCQEIVGHPMSEVVFTSRTAFQSPDDPNERS